MYAPLFMLTYDGQVHPMHFLRLNSQNNLGNILEFIYCLFYVLVNKDSALMVIFIVALLAAWKTKLLSKFEYIIQQKWTAQQY